MAWYEKNLDRNFPALGEVSEETVRKTAKMSHRLRGNVRLILGRVFKDRDYRDRRDKAFAARLP